MKLNTIVFTVILFCASGISKAQLFEGGFFAGITGSQIDGDQYAGYRKPGLTAGLAIGHPFNKRFSLNTEMKFIMKGATKPITNLDPNIYSVSLYYIELPVIARFNMTPKVAVETGLATGFLLYASNDLGFGNVNPSPPFKSIDFNILAGVSYAFNEKLSANVRVQYSVIPVRDYPGNPLYYRDSGQFNNILAMSVYYKVVTRK